MLGIPAVPLAKHSDSFLECGTISLHLKISRLGNCIDALSLKSQ